MSEFSCDPRRAEIMPRREPPPEPDTVSRDPQTGEFQLNYVAKPNGTAAPQASGNQDSNTNYRPKAETRALSGRHRASRVKPFKGLISSADFLKRMGPPDYVIEGLILAGCAYTLTGVTGHGKTLIALLKAIQTAQGEWFCGRKCRKGKVAFFAGENPDNVRVQYYSMCADLGIDPPANILWHDGKFTISEYKAEVAKVLAANDDLVLCIFDSLQAFFEGDDDNSNMEMYDLAVSIRELTEAHPARPASLIIAHPIKNAGRESLLPRGGSSILNELDGNFAAWCDETTNTVELHWQGKFRGAPFDPVKLELVLIKPEGLVDARGDQMPCKIIRPLGPQREAEKRAASNDRLINLLALLRDDPSISQEAAALALGVGRSTVQRDIKALKKDGLVRQYPNGYKLTKQGEIALEMAGK
ncbi:winged helix-turn-helix transcriptional regulator [Sinorhizobium meliloti]|nr:winged helix-turn-helix transcriptional regulator [Sinorhizobium meliloti]